MSGTGRDFDPLHVPLAGVHLVEASAGTGKTHNLAELFVRLVAEGGLAAREIVVVTFTEAATQELRGRVRDRLREVRDALRRGGDSPGDALAQALREREAEPGLAHSRIETALAGFDEAMVSTIHGFCGRVLEDDAHLGGEGPLAIDPDGVEEIRRVALADWWRRVMNGETGEDPDWVLGQWRDPVVLARELGPAWGVDPEALVPAASAFDRAGARELLEALRREGAELHACGELASLHAVLAHEDTKVSRDKAKSPYAPERFAGHFADVCAWLAGGDALAVSPEALAAFCGDSILAHLHKRVQGSWKLPRTRVCEWAARAAAAMARIRRARIAALRHEALAIAREALARRRRRARTRTLDALITDLRDALHGPDGEDWTARLRGRFRAAIVDEFQDTDARQYAIFRRIFAGGAAPCLFLIGDPKQSIYGFRGGDVFAYNLAAHDAGAQPWTLRDNWRADPRLVEALNRLLERAPRPFLLDFIGFSPSRVPSRREPVDAPLDAPLEFALVAWSGDKPPSKEKVKDLVVPWLADRIARDLERDAAAGVASDIAVLVPRNDDIERTAQALEALGVPHFALGRSNVFDSREARELAIVLAALAEPADARLWRAALLTALLGASIPDIQAANEGSPLWMETLARRAHLVGLWRDDGIAALTRAIATAAAPRLLAGTGGERRLANLAHLGELLQAAAQRHDTPGALHTWMRRQMREARRTESNELRPASDSAPVRIMTMHRSKGLQFACVYVPFLWDTHDKAPRDLSPLAFHDARSELRVELGSDDWDANAARRAEEEQAEMLRLGYVALTRARRHAVAVLAPTGGFAKSAPARWLRAPGSAGDEGAGASEIRSRVEALVAEAEGRVAMTDLVTPEHPVRLQLPSRGDPPVARAFLATIDRASRVASFSSLVREESTPERPDHDEASGVVEIVDAEGPVAAWPRGRQVGICVHAVLQELDFARWPDEKSVAHLERTARRQGFEARDIGVFKAWIDALVACEILPGTRLSGVPAGRRPAELEFVFSLASGNREQLAHTLGGWPSHARTALEWQRLAPRWQGLMHGFVDLVVEHGGRYYVVDYKTNFLGTRAEDYSGDALRRAVRDEAYDLQYLIYLVALHRHLRFRLGTRYEPAQHLGGAIYLFLRGLGAGPGHGIHRDVPEPALIAALDGCFAGADA